MPLKRDERGHILPPNGAIAQWIRFIITILIIPMAAWFVQLERWRVRTEATRWTLSDHNRYAEAERLNHQQLLLQIQSLQDSVNGKVDRTDAPPEAYRDEINRRFDEVAARLARIEERIR